MPDLPIKTNWQFKEKFSQMKLIYAPLSTFDPT